MLKKRHECYGNNTVITAPSTNNLCVIYITLQVESLPKHLNEQLNSDINYNPAGYFIYISGFTYYNCKFYQILITGILIILQFLVVLIEEYKLVL